MRHAFRTIIAAVVAAVLAPMAAAAQLDPYESDPFDLVAYAEQVRTYAGGADVIEVFVCDVPDGEIAVDLGTAVDEINRRLQPYFGWLSANRYQPVFVPGGVVVASSPSGWPDIQGIQGECEALAEGASSGTAHGAMVIVDADYSGGYATAGVACEVVSECPTTFPFNGRIMVVGASTVVPSPDLTDARFSTVAHELGHMLDFPHSFGGLTMFIDGVVYEYDNPMDIMSGGNLTALDVGTIALNRYAAGWMNQAVAFHRGGQATYRLSTIGRGGTAMLVLPSDIRGMFTFVDVREQTSFDSGLSLSGVEVYSVDQRGPACGLGAGDVCWGADRRTTPVPATDDPESLAHVFGDGDVVSVGTVDLVVAAGGGPGEWLVTVSGAPVSERFVDDDGSVHEANIEIIADLGVTRGCNPPLNSWYCPVAPVTRAEMAVFLARALADVTEPTTGAGVFRDVPSGVWYSDAIARMYELGITTGYTDGTYRPHAPITRGEMAALLDRAFERIVRTSAELVFTDVPADAFYSSAAQALYDSGVSLGCSTEPAFCPADSVTRGQMASFLARILTP